MKISFDIPLLILFLKVQVTETVSIVFNSLDILKVYIKDKRWGQALIKIPIRSISIMSHVD